MYSVGDILAIGAPIAFALPIGLNSTRIPNWYVPFATLLAVSVGGFLARTWAKKSTHWFPQLVGDFYVFATIGLIYSNLGPLIDLVSPQLADAQLAAIDQSLLGVQASVWVERWRNPWLTEILFIVYVSFFFWQMCLGAIFHLRRNGEFDDYKRLLIVSYVASDLSYVLVPAIGPRFHIAEMYRAPLEGVFVGTWIRDWFAHTPMLRDCFPSGHTAVTLLVLVYAWQKGAKRFAMIMLPFGAMIIFSTIYCRFHYLIDVICAVPFVLGVLSLNALIERWTQKTVDERAPDASYRTPGS
jgi:membrane-associated phospholipid phosphatase